MSVISEEELREIVEVVWMTVLELPIGHGEEGALTCGESIISQISISGAWQGVVTVRASEQFLSHAAGVMFSCSAEDSTEMDRTDTLTELTNMLGGTVKCLLPEICDLSLPTILSDGDADTQEHVWFHFSCDGRPLSVAVTAAADNEKQAA
ncbi:MAG: chemotaxis protein CheX [Granulosicoccus sp.]